MKPKRSKSWDINYHWIEYRTKMGHLNPYWERGIHNRAGYFTKHNPLSYHKKWGTSISRRYTSRRTSFCTPHSARRYVNLITQIRTTMWCHHRNVRVTDTLVQVIEVIIPVILSNLIVPKCVHTLSSFLNVIIDRAHHVVIYSRSDTIEISKTCSST